MITYIIYRMIRNAQMERDFRHIGRYSYVPVNTNEAAWKAHQGYTPDTTEEDRRERRERTERRLAWAFGTCWVLLFCVVWVLTDHPPMR